MTQWKNFCARLAVVPFESAAAVIVIWVGIAAFFDVATAQRLFNASLPQPMAIGFNIAHIVSGFAVISGLGWGYRNLEMFGLILLLGALLVRVTALWNYAGLDPLVSSAIIQSAVFGISSLVRLKTLFQNRLNVLIHADDILTKKDINL